MVNLAKSLVELRHTTFVTQRKAREIVALWNQLGDADRGSVSYPPRHKDRLLKGRFKTSRSKTTVTPGVESLKR